MSTAAMSHADLMGLLTTDTSPRHGTHIYCPPPLLRLLERMDLMVVRPFVVLLRGTESAAREQQVVKELERALTEKERVQFAKAIPRLWARRHPVMEELIARWTPAAPSGPRPVLAWDSPEWMSPTRALRYGLTEAAGRQCLSDQGYRCAVCRTPFAHPDEMCMDHNHDTGAFRAILCVSCNTGLGLLKDSVPVLRAALAYLERHGSYGPQELP